MLLSLLFFLLPKEWIRLHMQGKDFSSDIPALNSLKGSFMNIAIWPAWIQLFSLPGLFTETSALTEKSCPFLSALGGL